MSHVYCPECGFQNPEAANFCAKCGALARQGEEAARQTQTFTPEERGRARRRARRARRRGRRRSSSARAAAARARLPLDGERTAIGRSPDCDDLPRRRHRLAQARGRSSQRGGRWLIEDQGSLNGTFVNRERVESAPLDDGDEIQIGKYRLTFLSR